MKINLQRLRGRFQGMLFVSAILIIVLLLIYTQRIVSTLRAESREILFFYTDTLPSGSITFGICLDDRKIGA